MRGRENSCTKCRIVFFFSSFFANDCSQRAVVGLPVKDDGLFNIPPHFPPFRLPDPFSSSSSSSVVVVVVPRKRSRSMRKLPRQELLTINYSSRYTLSLRATPFRALSTVTHANDGGARGLRTQHSPLTYRYTGIFGRRERERERSERQRERERGEATGFPISRGRTKRELPRIYILLRAPETDCRALFSLFPGSLFVSYFLLRCRQHRRVLADTYCYSNRARTALDLHDVD